ncbi:MAG TPA: BadF/BadG/BcrA/BcrD ATPase family protein [Candidatus Baltobacteraceae bacterium]|nr:BadF/BadG/BcrA/BcrD ATPase family protein [Candidatus Baltobacteraceae bacterium]
MPNVIVGVDAGGTKTAVAHRVDDGPVRVLTADGANAATLGAERAVATIASLVERTLDGAHPHALFVGMAGGGTPELANAVQDGLQSRFERARIAVRDDASIALRANIPDGDGVALIAGTGSIAYAEREGQSFRTGGFGYLLGDEGSGFSLGAAAIKYLLRVYDDRAKRDALADAVEKYLNTTQSVEVIANIYGSKLPVATIAGAAAIVIELAGTGERSATKIVQGAALELSELAKTVVRKAGLTGSSAPIAFSGGLLAGNSILSYLLETRLLNEFPSMPVVKTANPPVTGALLLAQRLVA